VVGSGNLRAGKVLVLMTGGTGGPEASIEKLAAAGVGTVIEMHLDEKLRKKAEEHNVNVVIAGHVASDNIGMNLWLDKLEERGISIKACSGFVRVKRS
jgi:putative NIF3 family GTP cyclohydrolase 1 type 2